MWITPVTDRTLNDVEYARSVDRKNMPELLKGIQNYSDWNRLAINMYHLAGILENYGHQITLRVKANWKSGDAAAGVPADVPKRSDIDQFRQDLKRLRRALYPFDNYTWEEWHGRTWTELDTMDLDSSEYFSKHPLPELPYTHYEKINEIERISGVLEEIVQTYGNLFRVSGTFSSGQLSYLPRFIEPHDCAMRWIDFDLMNRTWAEVDDEQRTAELFFNKCHDPYNQMMWSEWNTLNRMWAQIDAEGRTAQDYFRKL